MRLALCPMAVLSLRVCVLRYEPAMERLDTRCQANRLRCFWKRGTESLVRVVVVKTRYLKEITPPPAVGLVDSCS